MDSRPFLAPFQPLWLTRVTARMSCPPVFYPPPSPPSTTPARVVFAKQTAGRHCPMSTLHRLPGGASRSVRLQPRAPILAGTQDAGQGWTVQPPLGRASAWAPCPDAGVDRGCVGSHPAQAGLPDEGGKPPLVLESVGSGQVGKSPRRDWTERSQAKAGCVHGRGRARAGGWDPVFLCAIQGPGDACRTRELGVRGSLSPQVLVPCHQVRFPTKPPITFQECSRLLEWGPQNAGAPQPEMQDGSREGAGGS